MRRIKRQRTAVAGCTDQIKGWVSLNVKRLLRCWIIKIEGNVHHVRWFATEEVEATGELLIG